MRENGDVAKMTKPDCINMLLFKSAHLIGYLRRTTDGNVMTTSLEYLPAIFGKYLFASSIVANREYWIVSSLRNPYRKQCKYCSRQKAIDISCECEFDGLIKRWLRILFYIVFHNTILTFYYKTVSLYRNSYNQVKRKGHRSSALDCIWRSHVFLFMDWLE